jgi:hypothetical protein
MRLVEAVSMIGEFVDADYSLGFIDVSKYMGFLEGLRGV